MPFIDCNGTNVHFTETGSGETVICLHTGPGSSAEWRGVAATLEERFRVLAMDLHGRGKTDSWQGQTPLGMDNEADLVKSLISSCSEPVHLVGHSYGGAVSLRVAQSFHHHLRSLTLIEPQTWPFLRLAGEDKLIARMDRFAESFRAATETESKEAAWKKFIEYYNGAGSWEALPEKIRSGFLDHADVYDKWRALQTNPTNPEDVRSLELPALVVCGDATTLAERRMSELVAQHLPNCRYVTIPGAGHMSPMTHPVEVGSLIEDHLQSAQR